MREILIDLDKDAVGNIPGWCFYVVGLLIIDYFVYVYDMNMKFKWLDFIISNEGQLWRGLSRWLTIPESIREKHNRNDKIIKIK